MCRRSLTLRLEGPYIVFLFLFLFLVIRPARLFGLDILFNPSIHVWDIRAM
jgi:hypothetical protein